MHDSELRFRGEISTDILNSLVDKHDSKDQEKIKNLIHKQQQTSFQQSTLSLENICWLIASVLCLYYTNIVSVILWDEGINRSLLYAAILFISVNIFIGIYLIIYLSKIKDIPSSKWNEYNPYLIPVATGAFVSGSIIMLISLWPVYGWLTAPILFTIFMGFIVLIINIPI
ncbi:transmembrane protein -like [Brachionus plicatilis]|uniref:Transmembrane protein-like n=1 Tax=Brachionus plicatilis TaxID=10195 RepID=A0A3M7RQS6_BRAPC|nr:transmembrane protein -like [Brachionus plicatilis]